MELTSNQILKSEQLKHKRTIMEGCTYGNGRT